MPEIVMIERDLKVRTQGLSSLNQMELSASVKDPDLLEECRAFLSMLVDYCAQSDKNIQASETVSFGYWLTKFQEAKGSLEAWELKSDTSDFTPGIDLAATYWRDQHEVCRRVQSPFRPPQLDAMVVVSKGVLEDHSPVQGVRYPSPSHMSGWWLTTDLYDGNIKTLKTVHIYHLSHQSPELVKYIALDYGYRFDLSVHEEIWYDEEVASEQP